MQLSNQLHTSAANLLYPFSSMLVGPQSQSARFGEEKIVCPIENRSLGGVGGTKRYHSPRTKFLDQYCTCSYTQSPPKANYQLLSIHTQSVPAGKRVFGLFCTKPHFQLLCLVCTITGSRHRQTRRLSRDFLTKVLYTILLLFNACCIHQNTTGPNLSLHRCMIQHV
jgi:hypothetical protein